MAADQLAADMKQAEADGEEGGRPAPGVPLAGDDGDQGPGRRLTTGRRRPDQARARPRRAPAPCGGAGTRHAQQDDEDAEHADLHTRSRNSSPLPSASAASTDSTTISLIEAMMPTSRNGSATSSRFSTRRPDREQQLDDDEDQQQDVEHLQQRLLGEVR